MGFLANIPQLLHSSNFLVTYLANIIIDFGPISGLAIWGIRRLERRRNTAAALMIENLVLEHVAPKLDDMKAELDEVRTDIENLAKAHAKHVGYHEGLKAAT